MTTKIERLRAKREKLLELRYRALKTNDIVNLYRVNDELKATDNAIAEAEQYEPVQLSAVLKHHGEDVKNRIYKALLECSLAADLLNDCAETVKEELKKIGLDDFHFRKDIEEMCKLSKNIAGLVIIPGQNVLTDMICDNAEYIDKCHDAANEHLAKTLKL